MDTRRRAPGFGMLTPGVHEAESIPGSGPLHQTASAPVWDRDALARRAGDALEANLARGFLLGEERFRQISETLQDVVFLTDTELTAILFVNAAYEEIWGRPREELYRDPMAFMQGVHPDDRARVMAALTSRPGSAYDVDYRVVRPDGDQRWVRTRGFPVRHSDGTITGIAGITEDTTTRARVRASHEQLMRGFTHDVKNPLGAADGRLALLAEGIYGALSPVQAECIAAARRSIRTALDLVGQMLDIERAQTGTIDLHLTSFDLGLVLRDLIDEYAPVAGGKQLALSLHIPTDGPEALVVYSDPTRVRQVVGNLVSNAVKYTQAGGSCSVEARLVGATSAPPQGPWIAVVVTDNGPGIPPEKQHLLFREFTRFSPDAASGSGIGLAISQQLARALDARISFESTPGAGSTFTFWLPKDRRVRGSST
jgi:PAS domain S-box-containing protein